MMSKKSKSTVIDLFCGAGGFSEGFKLAGYEVLLGLDCIGTFVETFTLNNEKAKAICEDIREITANDIKKKIGRRKVDVVVGGPPCQGFSMAGRRDSKDPRNSLFMEFVRIIDKLKPKYFAMENVKGLLSTNAASGDSVVEIIKQEFKRIGYKVDYRVLMAADYGVPQKRQRIFFLGTNTKRPICFPEPTHQQKPEQMLFGKPKKKWVGVGEVLLGENEVDKKFFHTPKMIKGFERRKDNNKKNGKGFGWQILKFNEPSYTISARYWKDGSDALVRYTDKKIRMLTPLECARIQSFPDTYKFFGSKKDTYTQIGNAAPPLLAKAIAIEIKKALKKGKRLRK